MYPMHPEDADFTYSTPAEIDRAHARSGCDRDADKCRCGGSGWVGSERDALYTCLFHFTGQPAEPEEEQPEAEAFTRASFTSRVSPLSRRRSSRRRRRSACAARTRAASTSRAGTG
jgi:hypothetical protein